MFCDVTKKHNIRDHDITVLVNNDAYLNEQSLYVNGSFMGVNNGRFKTFFCLTILSLLIHYPSVRNLVMMIVYTGTVTILVMIITGTTIGLDTVGLVVTRVVMV